MDPDVASPMIYIYSYGKNSFELFELFRNVPSA
jgi:hypothetical protein